jgi:hypothetical protein
MCNVCVANLALSVSSCGKQDCVAFQQGHPIAWSNGPTIKRRVGDFSAHAGDRPIVYVRARGRDPEGRAQFQLRRERDAWLAAWQTTDDLANAMSMYGLDVK